MLDQNGQRKVLGREKIMVVDVTMTTTTTTSLCKCCSRSSDNYAENHHAALSVFLSLKPATNRILMDCLVTEVNHKKNSASSHYTTNDTTPEPNQPQDGQFKVRTAHLVNPSCSEALWCIIDELLELVLEGLRGAVMLYIPGFHEQNREDGSVSKMGCVL